MLKVIIHLLEYVRNNNFVFRYENCTFCYLLISTKLIIIRDL